MNSTQTLKSPLESKNFPNSKNFPGQDLRTNDPGQVQGFNRSTINQSTLLRFRLSKHSKILNI